tara:strand:+ start:967 stop:1143 length:177 start_codon:yes stop_codon:yes gene_type:complete
MHFDPHLILSQTSTTMLALIEELACEYSRYLIAEDEKREEQWQTVEELVTAIEYLQRT